MPQSQHIIQHSPGGRGGQDDLRHQRAAGRFVQAAAQLRFKVAGLRVPVTSGRPASEPGPAVIARQIIDSSRYLTLATADGAGRPWASPVWYANEDYASFLWVSRPHARHSRNIAARATVSAVIFDSTVHEAQAQAVYLEALAEELAGAERDRAIAIFSRRSRAFGLSGWRTADVTGPAPHRLYRASASACFVLGPGDQRLPVWIGEHE